MILEYLNGHEIIEFEQSPALIATNIDKSAGHVRRRVRILSGAGLIYRTNDTAGYYAITELGERYLEGDLSDEEVDELNEFDPDTAT